MDGSLFIFGSGNITGTLNSPSFNLSDVTIQVSGAVLSGTVDSDLLPSTGDTYNIGSPSIRWDSIYVNDIDILSDPFIHTTGGTITGTLTVDGVINANEINSTGVVNINDTLFVSNTGITFTGNFVPSQSGVSNIGSTSKKVGTIYADNIVSIGLDNQYVAVTGGNLVGTITATTVKTNDLRSTSITEDLYLTGKDININASNNIFLRTNDDLKLQVGLSAIYPSVDLIPNNPFVDLGSASSPFANLYVASISTTGLIIAVTGVNIGSGVGVFANQSGASLEFKSIQVSGAAAISSSADTIFITITGNVVGPAASTDSNVALFDGTTGRLLKDSAVKVSPSGSLYAFTSLAAPLVTGTTASFSNITGTNISGTTLDVSTIVASASITSPARDFVFCESTGTQIVAIANTFQNISLETNRQISGWTHTPGGFLLTGNVTGFYSVDYNTTTAKSGGGNSTFEARAMIDGVEVSGSQVSYVNNANNLPTPLSSAFIINIISGQAFSLQMTASTINSDIRQGGTNASIRPSVTLRIVRAF